MARAAVIGELRRLRESGVDIGVALTAKTEVMEEQLKKLLGEKSMINDKRSPKKDAERNWPILLPRLNLRTLYRCLLLYKECNRAVGGNLVWQQLIARDLGIVPTFIRDLKLYYLRAMNFDLPLTLYVYEPDESLPPKQIFHEVARDVLLADRGAPRCVRGNIIQPNTVLPYNVTIRKIFPSILRDRSPKYLSTEGQFYNREGRIVTLFPELPPGEMITDILFLDGITILTKSGKVYVVPGAGGARSRVGSHIDPRTDHRYLELRGSACIRIGQTLCPEHRFRQWGVGSRRHPRTTS